MYPILKDNCILVKQKGDSLLHCFNSMGITTELINKTAAEILELCDGSKTLSEISDIIAKKYNESHDKVNNIVKNFIDVCIEKGYVEIKGEKIDKSCQKAKGSFDLYVPSLVTLEVTKRCNFECLHCYNQVDISHKELTLDEINDIFGLLSEYGVMKLIITGGEPTLRKDLTKIIEKASRKFKLVTVISNGYFITDDFVNNIGEYKNVIFQISIDGLEETHDLIRGKKDSFKRALEAINRLNKKNIYTVVACTINQLNFSELALLTEVVKKSGAKQIRFGILMYLGKAKENQYLFPKMPLENIIKIVNNLKKKYQDENFFVGDADFKTDTLASQNNCGAGYQLLYIDSEGNVFPCPSFRYYLGNVRTDSLYNILSSSKLDVLKNLESPGSALCSECRNSVYCHSCSGVAYSLDFYKCRWKEQLRTN